MIDTESDKRATDSLQVLGFPKDDLSGFAWTGFSTPTLVPVVAMGAPVTARLERKISAGIQQRIGPGYAGPLGIIQAPADGVKPLSKEDIIPSKGDPWSFSIGPAMVIAPVPVGHSVIPSGHSIVLADPGTGVPSRIAASSIAPLGPPMTGYGSNNKYSFSGGPRAAAQSTSYEIPSALRVSPISLRVARRKTDSLPGERGLVDRRLRRSFPPSRTRELYGHVGGVKQLAYLPAAGSSPTLHVQE